MWGTNRRRYALIVLLDPTQRREAVCIPLPVKTIVTVTTVRLKVDGLRCRRLILPNPKLRMVVRSENKGKI